MRNGIEGNDVVDAELIVSGIDSLKGAAVSVMPNLICGHANAR